MNEKNSNNESWRSVKVTPAQKAEPKPQPDRKTIDAMALMKQDVVQPRLRVLNDFSKTPIPTVQTSMIVSRTVTAAPNRYQQETRKVNSKHQAKGVSGSSGPPRFVGSSFNHLPNAVNRPLLPPPQNVKLPQPQATLTGDQFRSSGMLNNRGADGKILGSPVRRFVPEGHVPYLAPDEPVGPDNPVKPLNDTWTACWDDEAGAIYYYNQITGEATWVPPEL